MNALLLPLLLAAAPAPMAPAQAEVEPIELSVMEMGCGGSEPVFADRSPLVADEALAVAEPAAPSDPAPDDADDVETESVTVVSPRIDRRCLVETGSRIRSTARRCRAQAGDAYDRDDLDRTGAVTTAEALRRLNPSVTIR